MSSPVGPWLRADMRAALADRDIATVYRILSRYGWSQRRIAAAVGHTQSEVSEILSGRRVQHYDVLVRIADGLGIPRGWLGCAYTDVAAPVRVPGPRLAISVDVGDEDPGAWLAA